MFWFDYKILNLTCIFSVIFVITYFVIFNTVIICIVLFYIHVAVVIDVLLCC